MNAAWEDITMRLNKIADCFIANNFAIWQKSCKFARNYARMYHIYGNTRQKDM